LKKPWLWRYRLSDRTALFQSAKRSSTLRIATALSCGWWDGAWVVHAIGK
jgi:hypothetical protein